MIKGNKMSATSVIRSSLFSIKNCILIAVCLQNAGYTLLRKYSTQTEDVSSKEILLMAEIIKMIVATYISMTDDSPSDAQGKGVDRLIWLLKNSSKIFVLAAIYGAMNILSFVALQYIGAGEFTICAQLKIMTTAWFSVMILKTTLSSTKWRALALLVLGCILVASPNLKQNNDGTEDQNAAYLQLLGYAAVLTEVCLSGFASIYFEKVIKSTNEVITIWERNFQLGFYSIIMYGGIILYEGSTSTRTPWSNWSMLTFLVAALGAIGGLLVAATLKYADSILKTLAAAGAIVLSTILGYIFLDGPLDLITCIGGITTIIAIANYTFDNTPPLIVQSLPSPEKSEGKC